MRILVTGGAGFVGSNRSGHSLEVVGNPDTIPANIPWFVTSSRKVTRAVDWQSNRTLDDNLDDVFEWLEVQRATLEPLLRQRPADDE